MLFHSKLMERNDRSLCHNSKRVHINPYWYNRPCGVQIQKHARVTHPNSCWHWCSRCPDACLCACVRARCCACHSNVTEESARSGYLSRHRPAAGVCMWPGVQRTCSILCQRDGVTAIAALFFHLLVFLSISAHCRFVSWCSPIFCLRTPTLI